MMTTHTISPCLWFDRQAEEAAQFYTSIFLDARIDGILRASVDTPGAKTGETLLVDCTLAGQQYHALNGGAHDRFNDAMSLVVTCQDHAEVDRLWDALLADGGTPVQCGWLKDKCGVSWQIVPAVLLEMLNEKDREKSKRVMEAMMPMVRLDIDALQQAYHQSA
jgi:predicted 3-demethylubiquinone-9 3-methyltransferase (glyoxalase superfamily)